MAVYQRGYRTYHGDLSGAPAWYVIYREGYSLAFRHRGFLIIGVLCLIWFVICGAVLYSTIVVADATEGLQTALPAATQLSRTLNVFYGGTSILIGLLAILIGAGLISADLRTQALSLYLVRPMGAWQYVLGKALILPRILLWTCLLPGCIYYLLVGLWQPPGEVWPWLAAHFDILASVVWTYLIVATSYTGLMLFLSARTDQGGVVISMAAAVLFGGSLLFALMGRLGGAGNVMKYAGLPVNTVSAIARNATSPRRAELLPEPAIALAVGVALLALGMWSALRRARTVEVSA